MSKKMKKLLITLCAVLGVTSLVACKAEQAYNEPIPETDLVETYTGETVNADGNLLVPFDVAYAEAFETGAYKYNEGQILLKMAKSYNGKRTNNLRKCGIASLAKFSETPNGNWWTAKLNGDFDAITAVKKARSLEEVLIADFDYIYETQSVEVEGDTTGILSDVCGNQKVGNQHHLKQCSIQESWKFLQKEGISAGGLSSVVLAVIDTGVDYTHPDLKANMWVNKNEIPDNGIDDDKNGYIDDVHGANVIANNGNADMQNTGNPMDDHGHGTHVAGIIGASNNKEGVVGIAYNAKIMAVKAGQASGVFNQSDIAEAILYAYEMGADVINMSFGGSACSIAVQDALATAYTTASLVAAAGNDSRPNEGLGALPNYPAALSYVIGVMSVDDRRVESAFTNYDTYAYNTVEYEVYAPGEQIMSTLPDGRYGALSGTSMAAPVVSGAAALLRSYFNDRDMYPSKFIMAQICATSEETAICTHLLPHDLPMILDVYKAFTKMPKPDVALYDYYLFDTERIAEGNSGDGVVDAGETIEIGAILRNRWGMSENTIVTIDDESSHGVDNPYVEILTASQNFEGVGTYSTKDTLTREGSVITGVENPLVIKIADNCPNDYLVVLNVTISCNNALDEKDTNTYTTKGEISFWVRNGVVLTGLISQDTTLTKDNYYIIPNTLIIDEGATLTIEAGTQLQFYSSDPDDQYAISGLPKIKVNGKLITRGTEEEPVKMFPSEIFDEMAVEISGNVELNYTHITNPYLDVVFVDHCYFDQNYAQQMFCSGISGTTVSRDYHTQYIINAQVVSNTVFYKIHEGSSSSKLSTTGGWSSRFEKCVFLDCNVDHQGDKYIYINCLFSGNTLEGETSEFSGYSRGKPFIGYIFKNAETGTTYVKISETPCKNENIFVLAEMMGGNICCIETEEEWKFLKQYVTSGTLGIIGLRYGENIWANGEPIGDFLPLKTENYDGYGQWACISEGKIMFGDEYDYGSHIIIEIPAQQDETGNLIEINQTYLESILQEWIDLGYTNKDYRFNGNAILNNFNETDVGKWLRIFAGTGSIGSTWRLGYNYWGTFDEELIESQIVDFADYATRVDIITNPFDIVPENTFPFVVDAYLLDSNGERVQTVGNEKITVVVQFNRDMNMQIPLRVRFGSSYPYAEYEISGEYVTPREWRGEYVLKTTIENGNQFFRIENGQAADDSWLKLYETPGRFTFELDTTAAQAMLMQGEATDTGIQLTWMQDDFDTLLGYNVYRSDKEDGYYTRLNDYVLSQEETSFFDDTVEPGKVYYYNFTVVKTDLTESTPSGKIVIMSKDTMAPDIYHSPVRTAYTDSNLVVSATITDNLMIKSAKLYYRAVGATEWKSVTMSALNSKYTGIIGAENLSVDGLEYYIEAFDGISYTYKGTAENSYFVTVKLAVDSSSLGDVDGDGIITVKDAQMLLMGINDLYNLSEEEFLRADIDGSGELQAWEALRILDYISGKVTTIVA